MEVSHANAQWTPKSSIPSERRDPGHEGSDPQLPGPQGGGVRLCAARPPQRPPLARLLARVRPPAALGQEIRRGHQVLQERPQVGQGQHTDSQGSLTPADPDAGP